MAIITRKDVVETKVGFTITEGSVNLSCPGNYIPGYPRNDLTTHNCVSDMGCAECWNWPVRNEVKND